MPLAEKEGFGFGAIQNWSCRSCSISVIYCNPRWLIILWAADLLECSFTSQSLTCPWRHSFDTPSAAFKHPNSTCCDLVNVVFGQHLGVGALDPDEEISGLMVLHPAEIGLARRHAGSGEESF